MLSERQSELISAFLDGEVTARQRQLVLRLLRRSSEARAFLQRLQENAFSLHQLPGQKLPDDFPQQVLGAIRQRGLRPTKPATLPFRPKAIPTWVGAAAAAVVLLFVGAGSYFYFAETTTPLTDDGRIVDRSDPHKLPDPKQDPEPERELPLNPMVPQVALGALAQFAEPIEIQLAMDKVAKPEAKTRVHQELKQDTSYHVKVSVPNPGKAVQVLQTAMQKQGITVYVDPQIKKIIDGKKSAPKTSFVLYTENMEPDEVAALIEQLGKDKGIVPASAVHQGGMLLAPMATDQRQEMSKLLGLKGKQQLEKPHKERRLELPMAVLGNPKNPNQGQGNPKVNPQPARNRIAVVLAVTPGAAFNPGANSAIQRFLRERKPPTPGTLQVVVVLNQV